MALRILIVGLLLNTLTLAATAGTPCLEKIQYQSGTAWLDVPEPIYILKGTAVTFRAVTKPECGSPTIRWGGWVGESETGATHQVRFAVRSRGLTDYQTVTATAGNTMRVRAIVYEVESRAEPVVGFPGDRTKQFGVGEYVYARYVTKPPVTPAQAGGLRWKVRYGQASVMPAEAGVAVVRVGVAPGTLLMKYYPATSAVPNENYERWFNALGAACQRGDMAVLLGVADQVQAHWGKGCTMLYLNLLWNISSALSSYDFHDSRSAALSQHYANTALECVDHMPWLLEMNFVLQLMGAVAPASNTVAVTEPRSVTARHWLHAWNRLERERDRSFDPAAAAKMATATVVPPAAITDPQLRARYEAAIAENQRRIRWINQQTELHSYGQIFVRCAEKYLIRAYSRPPNNVEELQKELAASLIDAETQARILKAVRRSNVAK